MELKLIESINRVGFDATLDRYKLNYKDYGHKIALKYDQIESPFQEEATREARGLVLEKDTWKVMSLAFKKFFNLQESHAPKIDWSTAKVYQKLDGTLCHVYYDWVKDQVCVGTTGTAEGEGVVGEFHYGGIGTFADLFWKAFAETRPWWMPTHAPVDDLRAFLKKYAGFTIAFELCTPYNIVVTPHTDCRVYLLGARDLHTGAEAPQWLLHTLSQDLAVPVAPLVPFDKKDPAVLLQSLEGMPFSEEGYVVVDKHFQRVKIKNPTYVAVHMLKESTAAWRIIDIVRSNEIGEFIATFPARRDEILALEAAFIRTKASLVFAQHELLGSKEYAAFEADRSKENRKAVALYIKHIVMNRKLGKFSSFFYRNLDGLASVDDYLKEFDGKSLYEILCDVR